MMTSKILKFVDFTKPEESRNLVNETFFLQIKKLINHISRATLWQKNGFVVEVTFNNMEKCKIDKILLLKVACMVNLKLVFTD